MIFHIAKKQGRSPNWQELKHAIERNFDGLLEGEFVPVNIFKEHLGFPTKFFQVRRKFKNSRTKVAYEKRKTLHSFCSVSLLQRVPF